MLYISTLTMLYLNKNNKNLKIKKEIEAESDK